MTRFMSKTKKKRTLAARALTKIRDTFSPNRNSRQESRGQQIEIIKNLNPLTARKHVLPVDTPAQVRQITHDLHRTHLSDLFDSDNESDPGEAAGGFTNFVHQNDLCQPVQTTNPTQTIKDTNRFLRDIVNNKIGLTPIHEAPLAQESSQLTQSLHPTGAIRKKTLPIPQFHYPTAPDHNFLAPPPVEVTRSERLSNPFSSHWEQSDQAAEYCAQIDAFRFSNPEYVPAGSTEHKAAERQQTSRENLKAHDARDLFNNSTPFENREFFDRIADLRKGCDNLETESISRAHHRNPFSEDETSFSVPFIRPTSKLVVPRQADEENTMSRETIVRNTVATLDKATGERSSILRFLADAEAERTILRQHFMAEPHLESVFVSCLTRKLDGYLHNIISSAKPGTFEAFRRELINNTEIIRPNSVIYMKAQSAKQSPNETAIGFLHRLDDLRKEYKLALQNENVSALRVDTDCLALDRQMLDGIHNAFADVDLRTWIGARPFRDFNELKRFVQEKRAQAAKYATDLGGSDERATQSLICTTDEKTFSQKEVRELLLEERASIQKPSSDDLVDKLTSAMAKVLSSQSAPVAFVSSPGNPTTTELKTNDNIILTKLNELMARQDAMEARWNSNNNTQQAQTQATGGQNNDVRQNNQPRNQNQRSRGNQRGGYAGNNPRNFPPNNFQHPNSGPYFYPQVPQQNFAPNYTPNVEYQQFPNGFFHPNNPAPGYNPQHSSGNYFPPRNDQGRNDNQFNRNPNQGQSRPQWYQNPVPDQQRQNQGN